jgi:hypothetical protein
MSECPEVIQISERSSPQTVVTSEMLTVLKPVRVERLTSQLPALLQVLSLKPEVWEDLEIGPPLRLSTVLFLPMPVLAVALVERKSTVERYESPEIQEAPEHSDISIIPLYRQKEREARAVVRLLHNRPTPEGLILVPVLMDLIRAMAAAVVVPGQQIRAVVA